MTKRLSWPQLMCPDTNFFFSPAQIEVFKQGFNKKLQEGQEKLCQMWLDWTRKLPEDSRSASSAEPEVSPWGRARRSPKPFYFSLINVLLNLSFLPLPRRWSLWPC